MSASLESFLTPRSIAIIGASPDPKKIRGALLNHLQVNGFPGAIYPVNPSYAELAGLRCYPSAAAIGAPVDLALVAIPAEAVLPALEECAAAGVRNAIIISSGFAEDAEADPALQGRIAELARRSGMRVLGPNTTGFYNEPARTTATFSPAAEHKDADPLVATPRIAVVAQSGGLGFALMNRGRPMGLAFSAIVTTGNEADLTASDFLHHLAGDPETHGILLFLETIRDPARFREAAARVAASGKPVVAIKVGRSAAGKLATASHTASLAGWDEGYDALFHHYGISVAADLDAALAIMAARVANPPAQGRRVAILTISGGAGALAADALSQAGLEVPELPEATQSAIRGFIPSYGATRNPVDLTAQGAQGGGTLRTAELLLDDPAIDVIAIVTTLANPNFVTLDGPALAALTARRRKPILVYSYTLPSALALRTLAQAGVVVLPSMTLLAAAARALSDKPLPPVAASGVRPLALRGPLTEHAAKAALAAAGIAVAPGHLVTSEAGLDAAAEALGYPLVLKVQSPDIPHKTEAGAVALDLADRAALHAAYHRIRAAAAGYAPGARIEGVLAERMAQRGPEMIVGVLQDPAAGPVITVGAGGTQAELFRDTARRRAPVSEAEAAAMLAELRSYPLLTGFRGAAPADVPALARLVAQLSQLAAASPDVAELELNPVIVHPEGQGVTVADALLIPAKGA